MANTYLTRSKSSPTSDKKGTISFWIKRSDTTSEQATFVSGGGSIDSNIFFDTSSKLNVYDYQSGAYQFRYVTSRVFRDPSAWYHIVVRIDTTDATAGDRVKIYVNGVQETVFDTSTNPSQNLTPLFFTNTYDFWIGSYRGSSGYTNGLYTHFHYTDGYTYDASTFGESDSVSGIWKPKTAPSVTYGTNGFFLKFENSGAMGTDSSGNSNTFTVSGTLTQTEDTPANNFATLNPLIYSTGNNTTLSNGNTTVTSSGASHKNAFSSLGVSSGKWYCEIEVDTLNTHQKIGVASDDNVEINKTSPSEFSGNANGYAYRNDGQKEGGGGSISSYGNTYTNGDIIGIAMDLDNSKLYFSKNGVFQNSGDPTSGATGTGAAFTLSSDKTYFIAINHYNSNVSDFNFGNGRFGTTALASSNSDSAGLGLFEYSVPSGYYSICTNNIKNYG